MSDSFSDEVAQLTQAVTDAKAAHDAEKAANADLRATVKQLIGALSQAQPPDISSLLNTLKGLTADAQSETAADEAAEPAPPAAQVDPSAPAVAPTDPATPSS